MLSQGSNETWARGELLRAHGGEIGWAAGSESGEVAIAVYALAECLLMKPYLIQLEISGPTALWARPDTMPNPVSYVAPTFSAAKGIFEAILRWKSVNVRPTRCEICAPVQFHGYVFNYVGPFHDGTAHCATGNPFKTPFLEMVLKQPTNIVAN